MVVTPWGDASELRTRKMRPGGGSKDARTAISQRERLFGAMVATVAEKGYEATTVADVSELSGVSKSSYYEHFKDKQDCFLAMATAIFGPALEYAGSAGLGGTEEQARTAFESSLQRIAAQPAAAKACLVEIYAAGPEAAALLDSTVDGVERLVTETLERIPERQEMPREIVRAQIGGVQKVIYKRLLRGEESELPALAPELWQWMLSVPPPPQRLRARRTRSVKSLSFEERQQPSTPAERLLRALAAVVSEKGYRETKIADVVERARTSQRTFYEHFEGKEDAMVAALDSGSSQMLAAALPAFRRGGSWQRAVHDTQEAMLHFAAEEPEYGRLGAVEMYGAGTRALEQREMVTEGMEGLLMPGYEIAPGVPPIAAEAIGGALYALLYDFVKEKGPGRLLELVPTFVYVTLAPFLGAEDAYETAVG
ncbi:MAG TPA: TetR/AcrR family transcriptional regulator [Solirubrobacterales bacterium]|nr:TetR/AcrR family transcriptional regulator [Solirubrobacterales bacterium]